MENENTNIDKIMFEAFELVKSISDDDINEEEFFENYNADEEVSFKKAVNEVAYLYHILGEAPEVKEVSENKFLVIY